MENGLSKDVISVMKAFKSTSGYKRLDRSVTRLLLPEKGGDSSSLVVNDYELFLVRDSLSTPYFVPKFEEALIYFLEKARFLGLVSSRVVLAKAKKEGSYSKYFYLLPSELELYSAEVVDIDGRVLDRVLSSAEVFSLAQASEGSSDRGSLSSTRYDSVLSDILYGSSSYEIGGSVMSSENNNNLGHSNSYGVTSLSVEEGIGKLLRSQGILEDIEGEAVSNLTAEEASVLAYIPKVVPNSLSSSEEPTDVSNFSISLTFEDKNSNNEVAEKSGITSYSSTEGVNDTIPFSLSYNSVASVGDVVENEEKVYPDSDSKSESFEEEVVYVSLDDSILPDFGRTRVDLEPELISETFSGSLTTGAEVNPYSFVGEEVEAEEEGWSTGGSQGNSVLYVKENGAEEVEEDEEMSTLGSKVPRKVRKHKKLILASALASVVALSAMYVAYNNVPSIKSTVNSLVSGKASTLGSSTGTSSSSSSNKVEFSPSVSKLFTSSRRTELKEGITIEEINSIKGMLASEGLSDEALARETLLLDLLPTYLDINSKLEGIGNNTDLSLVSDVEFYKSIQSLLGSLPNDSLKSSLGIKFSTIYADYEVYRAVTNELSLYPETLESYTYLDSAINGMSDMYSSGLKSAVRTQYEDVKTYMESLGYFGVTADTGTSLVSDTAVYEEEVVTPPSSNSSTVPEVNTGVVSDGTQQ